MLRLITTRTLLGLLALLAFLAISFVAIESLIPGDQLTMLRLVMSQSELDALRGEMGITDPLPIRFWRWLTAFVSGEVFTSEARFVMRTDAFGRLSTDLGSPIARTLFVFVGGLTLAYLLGTWLGRMTGKRGPVTAGVTVGGIALYSIFPPFLGFLLAFYLRFPILRLRSAILGPKLDLWMHAPVTETHVYVRMTLALFAIGAMAALLAAAVRRRWHRPLPALVLILLVGSGWFGLLWLEGIHLFGLFLLIEAALPLMAFVLLAFAEFTLIMQTGMAETRHEDYVLTARAKGLTPKRIRDIHIARGASLVLMTRLAVSIPYLLAGLVIVERALGWEGIGSLLFGAIEDQDLFVVMSMLAFIGLFVVAVRVTTEILEGLLDPRLRIPQKVEKPS